MGQMRTTGNGPRAGGPKFTSMTQKARIWLIGHCCLTLCYQSLPIGVKAWGAEQGQRTPGEGDT